MGAASRTVSIASWVTGPFTVGARPETRSFSLIDSPAPAARTTLVILRNEHILLTGARSVKGVDNKAPFILLEVVYRHH